MIPDIAALIFALVFPSVVTWFYFVQLGGGSSGRANFGVQLAYAVGKIVQFGFPVLYVWLLYPDSIFLTSPAGEGIWLGLGFGALVAAGAFMLYFVWLRPSGLLDAAARVGLQKLQDMNVATPARFLLLAIFYSLAHSFLEEYYWRWFVFGWLKHYLPLVLAFAVASIGFMSHHVILLWTYFPDRIFLVVVPLSLSVAVGGVFWCWLYNLTGALNGPWASHLLVDAAIFGVGYLVLRARM